LNDSAAHPCNASGARFSFTMSNYEDPHPKKKVTAATTDAPQEEFIEQENVPSKVEKPAEGAPGPTEPMPVDEP